MIHDLASLRRAAATAKPGSRLLLEPGSYVGSTQLTELHGTAQSPIVLGAADPQRPPRFVGGLQLSRVSYLEVRDLLLERSPSNGLNIDDGGIPGRPSHHVTLRNLTISDLPRGNHDGIKLSGVDDFQVEGCRIERWGGSAIDLVGCHRGKIVGCLFRSGGDNGVQGKGGTSQLVVQRCRFEEAGERALNLGGSTGLVFFRPAPGHCEAKDLTVEGCTIRGSTASVAFVGVDGALVRFNTIYLPQKWAFRILQETRSPGFVPCRKGVIEDNLVVFRSDAWAESGLNIGPGTAPETFRFARNFWYCTDRPERSRPRLPVVERDGSYGLDPLVGATLGVAEGSPALRVGAHALPVR